jgi:transposase
MKKNCSDQFAAYLGIDWGDKKHDCCLKSSDSDALEFSVLPHSPEAIDSLAQSLRSRFAGRPIAICLEQSKGPLIYALLKYDFFILFPINPQSLKNYRKAFSPANAKDDPSDAELQLDFLIKHMDKLRPWRPSDTPTRKLQLLAENRRRLVNDKTRVTNRLTSLLKCYYPHVLQWLEDIDTLMFCDFISTWPCLEKVQRARKTTLEKFFIQHKSRRRHLIDQRIDAIGLAIPLTTDPAIIDPSITMALCLVKQLRLLIESIKTFDDHIKEIFQQHKDSAIFSSLPGAGKALAPRLLTAFGSDRNRYASAQDVVKYAGIAPVTKRSGQSEWVHWRFSCSKFLRQSFVEWTGESIKYSFWANVYYQKQRNKGNSHHAAVRALAFKWTRIIFRCWQNNVPYDESTYLLALKKKALLS